MSEVVHWDCARPSAASSRIRCTGRYLVLGHYRLSPGEQVNQETGKVTCPACLVWLAIDCLERASKAEPERARMRIDEVVDAAMGMRA